MKQKELIENQDKIKIGIILFSNLRYSPYLDFYTNAISKLKNCEFKVIYFNRDKNLNETSNEQYISIPWMGNKGNGSSKIVKLFNFQRFKRRVIRRIKKEKFDFLIVIPTMPNILLSKFLCSKYKNRYITDIRDYTYEHVKSFFKKEAKVLKNAAMRVISSPGFKEFLPQEEYYICHNISKGDGVASTPFDKSQPIVISYIGSIGYEEQCKKLIDLVEKDNRFELHFYGNDAAGIITAYVDEKKCDRVMMKGPFSPSEKPQIYEKSSLVFNCYGNDTPLVKYAISNKFYDGALYRRPLLVSPDTVMQEISGEYAYALNLNEIDDLDGLFAWYHTLDPDKYNQFVAGVVQQALEENHKTEDAVLETIVRRTETKCRENGNRKVFVLTTTMAPYRVNLFNELGKLCDLTVCFETKNEKGRNELWYEKNIKTFKCHTLIGWQKSRLTIKKGLKGLIKKYNPDICVAYEYSTLTAMSFMLYCKRKKIPYVINCDGAFINSNPIKTRIKRFFIKRAAGCIAGGDNAVEYFKHYGAKEENIYKHTFTTLYSHDLLTDLSQKREICELQRKTIPLNTKNMVISVGSFIHRKGFDVLLKAWEEVDDFADLYIVGGTPTQEYLQLVQELKLKNVHFVDFMPWGELKKYFCAADLFVLPTREDVWGLVVNEAMACGLPVVTTNRCVAGLELVQDGANGYIVPVEDAVALAEKIKLVLSDESTLRQMGEKSLEIIQQYTIENSTLSHFKNFEAILGAKANK